MIILMITPSNSGNYYKDSCLVAAGVQENGGAYSYTPFNIINVKHQSVILCNINLLFSFSRMLRFGLEKPLMIGEMSQVCSSGINNIVTMYNHAYNQGYQVTIKIIKIYPNHVF